MKEKNNKGQSTIEFILTFTAAVGFIFLFLKLALNYTNGYMVHHATFMASRAYLVRDDRQTIEDGDVQAFKAAKEVFKKNLPDGLISPDLALEEKNHNGPDKVKFLAFVGIWVEFFQTFSLGFVGGKDKMAFRSESFLGREPTRTESTIQVCKAITFVTKGREGIDGCAKQATLDDNGG